jgi:hypothetical protein
VNLDHEPSDRLSIVVCDVGVNRPRTSREDGKTELDLLESLRLAVLSDGLPLPSRAGKPFAVSRIGMWPGDRGCLCPAITLSLGQYYVLADNRYFGADSRFLGPIRVEQILGCVSEE